MMKMKWIGLSMIVMGFAFNSSLIAKPINLVVYINEHPIQSTDNTGVHYMLIGGVTFNEATGEKEGTVDISKDIQSLCLRAEELPAQYRWDTSRLHSSSFYPCYFEVPMEKIYFATHFEEKIIPAALQLLSERDFSIKTATLLNYKRSPSENETYWGSVERSQHAIYSVLMNNSIPREMIHHKHYGAKDIERWGIVDLIARFQTSENRKVAIWKMDSNNKPTDANDHSFILQTEGTNYERYVITAGTYFTETELKEKFKKNKYDVIGWGSFHRKISEINSSVMTEYTFWNLFRILFAPNLFGNAADMDVHEAYDMMKFFKISKVIIANDTPNLMNGIINDEKFLEKSE